MKPTTRTCHATRILLELAHNGDGRPLRASALSVGIGISIKLLDKIVRPLKAAGLIRSVRGAAGGYVLGRTPAAISLADILVAMEGAVFKPQCCEADADCLLMDGCPTGAIWVDIARHMEARFRATTLADFLASPREVCPARAARSAREAEPLLARSSAPRSWSRSRISRRRKPGTGHPAQRLTARPRPA